VSLSLSLAAHPDPRRQWRSSESRP
jgi:hypothetical protein